MKTVVSNAVFHPEKCVGCRTCLHVCPTKAYTPSTCRPLEKKRLSPCIARCPVGNDVEGFVALTAQRKYLDAYALLLETNPLPGVTGRVCHHVCESSCNRVKFDEGVAVHLLERFVADHAMEMDYRPKGAPVSMDAKVAVVGSGPAGLSCAYHLGRMGYRVTVFEAADEPGGMLRYGIPEYRLPKKVLDWEIGNLASFNIDIRVGQRLGDNLTFDALKEYDAVFLSIGFDKSRRLMIPGEDGKGVSSAIEFLREVNSGRKVDLSGKVAVIGGGNSAVDAARCALRLGAKPVILYRRSIEEMPALAAEREECEREGIEIVPFVTPGRIVAGEEGVRHIECLRTRPGDPDKDGRRIPVLVEGSEFSLEVDRILVAAGEGPDYSCLHDFPGMKVEGLTADANGTTPMEGIFAGGDVATKAGTVSEAIGSGKRGAMSIHRFLIDESPLEPDACAEPVGFEELNPDYFYDAPRMTEEQLDPLRAACSFDEVCGGFGEPGAVSEAARCLGCAVPPTFDVEQCRGCVNCADRCPAGAITIGPAAEPKQVGVDPAGFDPDEIYAICKRAKLHPKQIVCYCTNTTAGEIVAAILGGAKTPEEISLTTGARTGCTVLCIQSIVKLLEVSGLPVRPSATHQTYGKTFTVWEVDPALKSRHAPRGYHFDGDMELIDKVFENK